MILTTESETSRTSCSAKEGRKLNKGKQSLNTEFTPSSRDQTFWGSKNSPTSSDPPPLPLLPTSKDLKAMDQKW